MIGVLLVDDHAVVREGYRRLLELQGDMRVRAEAADGAEALAALREQSFDVAIVDLALPGLGGLELISRLRQREQAPRVLAFSMHRDPVWATQALRAGALGYVTKSSPPEHLVQAVRAVAAGRRTISSDMAGEVAAALLAADTAGAPQGLSPREFEVLRGLLAGRAPREIADKIGRAHV